MQLKKCQLIIHMLNSYFRYYMGVFVMVGIAVVALLLYGTLRYWRLGPQAIMMFPPCALRCGFEVLSPLALAGTMTQDCDKVMESWRRGLEGVFGVERKYGMRLLRSCGRLRCRSGMLFSFGKVIFLVAIDTGVNIAVTLLVSF